MNQQPLRGIMIMMTMATEAGMITEVMVVPQDTAAPEIIIAVLLAHLI